MCSCPFRVLTLLEEAQTKAEKAEFDVGKAAARKRAAESRLGTARDQVAKRQPIANLNANQVVVSEPIRV